MQTLGIISVNIWQILISLANLVIIFLILKKFLWKPVSKVMKDRQDMVDKQFADAAEAQAEAEADKAAWAKKLATADEEAAARIAAAGDTARRHSDRVIVDARVKADGIKQEIVSVGAELAEKMLERELNAADHEKMIQSFLDEMGDAE